MKKIFACALFVVATFTLGCSQNSVSEDRVSVLGPDIEFEMTEHDFGTLEHKGDGSVNFNFTNTGAEPLILSNVRSSCGCTIPQWPREPLNAGETASIKVKYDTKRIGKFSKSISVYSNATSTPIVLRIRGEVENAASAKAN